MICICNISTKFEEVRQIWVVCRRTRTEVVILWKYQHLASLLPPVSHSLSYRSWMMPGLFPTLFSPDQCPCIQHFWPSSAASLKSIAVHEALSLQAIRHSSCMFAWPIRTPSLRFVSSSRVHGRQPEAIQSKNNKIRRDMKTKYYAIIKCGTKRETERGRKADGDGSILRRGNRETSICKKSRTPGREKNTV